MAAEERAHAAQPQRLAHTICLRLMQFWHCTALLRMQIVIVGVTIFAAHDLTPFNVVGYPNHSGLRSCFPHPSRDRAYLCTAAVHSWPLCIRSLRNCCCPNSKRHAKHWRCDTLYHSARLRPIGSQQPQVQLHRAAASLAQTHSLQGSDESQPPALCIIVHDAWGGSSRVVR
jgi:hypothetical protein